MSIELLNLLCLEVVKWHTHPVQDFLGALPDISGEVVEFSLPINIPETAKEILVFTWVTTRGDEAFHRYYYQLETFDTSLRTYPQYMNVAATENIVLNSENLWMPVSAKSKCLSFPATINLIAKNKLYQARVWYGILGM